MTEPPGHFFDRQGESIGVEQWGRLFGDMDYKRVARTAVKDAADPTRGWEVSTVWLGLDHGLVLFSGGRRQIFETMVFAIETGFMDQQCDRYETEAEAIQGHADMVTALVATVEDPVIVSITSDDQMDEWLASLSSNGDSGNGN